MSAVIRTLGVILVYGWFGMSSLVEAKSEDPSKGSPKLEVVAFANCIDHLDGPGLEALGHHSGRKASNDKDGNWFFMTKLNTSRLRCLNVSTGLITTIVGDNRWGSNLNIEEGPAAYFPNIIGQPQAGDQSMLRMGIMVYGRPLKGEDYGSIYVYGMLKRIYRIYKNKEKKDRWWFKALGKVDGAKPPAKTGATAKVAETDFANARIGEGWIQWDGNLYKFDEKAGIITCILSVPDYQSKVQAILNQAKGKIRVIKMKKADRLILSEDGSMYVMHPWREGHVFKVSADRSKIEHIVQCNNNMKGWNIDGEGLNTTWHCGPSYIKTTNGTLLLRAIDSATVRRYQKGRISFLGLDGQWREMSKTMKRNDYPYISAMGYKPAAHGLPYIYLHYPGGGMRNDFRMFRFGPVDFEKPTVGPLVQVDSVKGEK